MTTPTTIAPGELLDYVFDFNGPPPGPWLQPGESIVSYTLAIQGPARQAKPSTEQGGAVTVWVTPTAKGPSTIRLALQIETNAGRRKTGRIDLALS